MDGLARSASFHGGYSNRKKAPLRRIRRGSGELDRANSRTSEQSMTGMLHRPNCMDAISFHAYNWTRRAWRGPHTLVRAMTSGAENANSAPTRSLKMQGTRSLLKVCGLLGLAACIETPPLPVKCAASKIVPSPLIYPLRRARSEPQALAASHRPANRPQSADAPPSFYRSRADARAVGQQLVLGMGVLRRVRLQLLSVVALRAADYSVRRRRIVRRAPPARPLHALRSSGRDAAPSELVR